MLFFCAVEVKRTFDDLGKRGGGIGFVSPFIVFLSHFILLCVEMALGLVATQALRWH
jgi:hypothetical protein